MEVEEEIIWEVKRVVDKRVNDDGRVDYLLEWKNWNGPPDWEPEENCNCPSLIKKFEQQRQQQQQNQQQPLPPTKSDLEIFVERRLKLEEIVGAVQSPDMMFIVKWHGIEQVEKVPLEILRKFYSQELVDFLLKNLKWLT